MACAARRLDARSMTSDHHRVRDAVPLPAGTEPLVARATRRDRYPIHITTSIEPLLGHLAGLLEGESLTVLTDESVDELYGATLVRGLRDAGFDPLVRAIPPGEVSKSLDQAVALWHWLAESGAARRDVLLAFGGGVIADLGGWVASAYMRGIPYINSPRRCSLRSTARSAARSPSTTRSPRT
jgi:3-dehydroquinate synthase